MIGPSKQSHHRVNLADFDVATNVLGPGRRAIVWVQGCPRRCEGCITPDMLRFDVDREWISADALAARVLDEMPLEGVTFVGGEPFSQAAGLARVASRLREAAGLSVVTYTGHTLEELLAGRARSNGWAYLLDATDLLVDGEYVSALACDLLWRGSSNQRLHFLTSRYESLAAAIVAARGRLLHISVGPSGALRIVGIPDEAFVARLYASLEARGVLVEETAAPGAVRGVAR
jgi:anaerobic ribonucleoside-triphosphate reductase activating protein